MLIFTKSTQEELLIGGYDQARGKVPLVMTMRSAIKMIALDNNVVAEQIVAGVRNRTIRKWIGRVESALGNDYIPEERKELLQVIEALVNNEMQRRGIETIVLIRDSKTGSLSIL